MNWQTLSILCILLDPRITWKPLRILRELRRRGIQRVPDPVLTDLGSVVRKRTALSFVRGWLEGELLSRHRGQWVLNSFVPPFPGKAFDRMFENLLSGRHLSPVSAFLAVTDACPYDCWHCSLKERRGGHLRTDQWCDAISALHRLGVSIVGFTGGEPLAREDLADLVGAASRGGAATIVFTSGALMNASRARELRDAGLWALCVSLDHPDPAQHDTLRGSPGAFVRAIEAVRLSRRHGFYTMLSSVATRPFVETRRFEGVLEIARREEVHEYRIVEPMPCGRLGEPDQATLLEPAHVAELRRFHVDTNRTGRLPKVCAFNQVESPEVFGCGAGTQHLFIDAAGEVCPCDFTPLSFGNVTQEPLPDLWLRMNQAMGNNPRTHCFIQKYHAVVRRFSAQGFPLARESSERVCAEAGPEPLPGYFAMVMGANRRGQAGDPPEGR